MACYLREEIFMRCGGAGDRESRRAERKAKKAEKKLERADKLEAKGKTRRAEKIRAKFGGAGKGKKGGGCGGSGQGGGGGCGPNGCPNKAWGAQPNTQQPSEDIFKPTEANAPGAEIPASDQELGLRPEEQTVPAK